MDNCERIAPWIREAADRIEDILRRRILYIGANPPAAASQGRECVQLYNGTPEALINEIRAVLGIAAHVPPTGDEIVEARKAAKEAGYGSGTLAQVIRNLTELAASSRRALDDLVQMRTICRNPNHALTDGSPSPHEIGPSCMAANARICGGSSGGNGPSFGNWAIVPDIRAGGLR